MSTYKTNGPVGVQSLTGALGAGTLYTVPAGRVARVYGIVGFPVGGSITIGSFLISGTEQNFEITLNSSETISSTGGISAQIGIVEFNNA